MQSAVNLQLLNYWRVNLTLRKSWDTWDDKLTRGGPTTIRPGIESREHVRRQRHAAPALGQRVRPTAQRRDFGNWTQTFGGELSLPAVGGAHALGRAARC